MKLSLSKNQGELVQDVIQHWNTEGIIDNETSEKLSNSFEIRQFDWKKLARYSFWTSIICILISLSTMIADDFLLDIIEKFFSSSNIILCLFFGGLAFGFYFFAFRRRLKYPEKIFSNEFLIVLGIIATAASISYLGLALDTGSGHFSLLFLIATIVYGTIGLLFPSKLIWVFSIITLGAWFGTETGYVSGWGSYYLGMNFPLRFVVFGIGLTALSFGFGTIEKLKEFQKSTYILGLLYLFIALWILSIFGNHGEWSVWAETKQIQLLGWGVLFGVFAIGAIIYGLKFDDYTSRSFGITFLFINLYTKFFEYFWDVSHKAVFFIILALTFWFVGKNAEKIWNLEFLNKKEIKEE